MIIRTATKKEPPRMAKLEVILWLDPDQYEDMKADGVSEREIEKSIEHAVTLRGSNVIQPVRDIKEVNLTEYD